ncbi:PQQ-binding-like beta-propeller repeat protein [Empedobacter falsenii]
MRILILVFFIILFSNSNKCFAKTRSISDTIEYNYEVVNSLRLSKIVDVVKYDNHLFFSNIFNTLLTYELVPTSLNKAPYSTIDINVIGKNNLLSSKFTIDGNLLYVTSHNGNIYCIDMNNRKIIWNFDMGNPIYRNATIDEKYVYTYDSSGEIIRFDKKTGKRDKEIPLTSVHPIYFYKNKIITESDNGILISSKEKYNKIIELNYSSRIGYKNFDRILVIHLPYVTHIYDLEKLEFIEQNLPGRGGYLLMQPYKYDDNIIFSNGSKIISYNLKSKFYKELLFDDREGWSTGMLYKDQYIFAMETKNGRGKIISINPVTLDVNWKCNVDFFRGVDFLKVVDEVVYFTLREDEHNNLYRIKM